MQKGQLFEAILEQQEAVHEGVWNVTTSQRRDVPTSRRPHVATLGQLLCKSTSGNVAMSQRRDVATSRRQCEICPPSLKAKGVQNSRHQKT